MTDQEKIAFRDKARKDFEGKEYQGEAIFQVEVEPENKEQILLLRNYDQSYVGPCEWYSLNDYDNVLAQCEKPFPKDGFCVGKSEVLTKELRAMMSCICRFHECSWSQELSIMSFDTPLVSIEQIKTEFERITKKILNEIH